MADDVGPYSQDPLTRIYNVQWTSGTFSFAGNIFYQKTTLLPAVGLPEDFQVSWMGGTSADGENWKSGGPTNSGLGLVCCVRGKVTNSLGEEATRVVAAGSVPVSDWYGTGYGRAYGVEPAAGISHDDGQTWSDAGIPVQQYTLKPANPITGQGAHTATGNSKAVAYHPPTQTFYVGASVIFSVGIDTYWEDRMYESRSGDGFAQVYSERRELTDPFIGYRWPEVNARPGELAIRPEDRCRVADRTMTTPPGPGTLFVVSFGPSQHAEYTIMAGDKAGEKSYLSVNGGRTGITLGAEDIAVPMALVSSVCGGKGHIVVVGWEDEDQRVGPVVFVSADDGKNWTPRLSELKHTNPGPGDHPNYGSSDGACSFSAGR